MGSLVRRYGRILSERFGSDSRIINQGAPRQSHSSLAQGKRRELLEAGLSFNSSSQ